MDAVDRSDEVVALLRRYEPVLHMNDGELFFPTDVEDYVRCCELLQRGPNGGREVVAPKGTLTLDQLVEFGAGHPRPGQYLRFVDKSFTRLEVTKWRLRPDRPRFHNSSRLARVGVTSRVIDALSRASLLFRGKVANGTEAAAEVMYREHMRPEHHPYYGRVIDAGGYTVLQYWFFYAFNDWRSRISGVNDHEADWEQVTVYLAHQPEGEPVPAWVVFSAHDEVGDDLRRRWDDPDLTKIGEHPVVYPGLGSHSGAYLSGEYLTTYEGAAFRRTLRLFRRISRRFLPWTRDQVHAGIGIPYIDYSRGDGLTIGPGQQREWSPVVIDDLTPWVFHYRGLWGNDTEDPFGGERGPAGPRYEKSGEVRGSWGDPVGWSGLRKVAPNPVAAAAAVHARLEELQREMAELDGEVDRVQTALRADVAAGESVAIVREGELLALSSQRVKARDEQLVLERSLATPPPQAGPHDHLDHRRLPLPVEEKVRRRFLAIWSSISTSLLLVAFSLLFLPLGFSIIGIGLVAMFVIFAIEAVARREAWRFVLAAAITFVVWTVVLAVTLALIADWRLAVVALLVAAALVLLVINTRELVRD
jgi:hypothetical protein